MTTTQPDASNRPSCASPTGFLWGAATAAYQIEGAVAEDGRTPSIWDTFAHTPGKVDDGDTGDVAVDHYHRFREDVALMADLGLTAYRFSVAWPRITPAVTAEALGPVNAAASPSTPTLVDALLAGGHRPRRSRSTTGTCRRPWRTRAGWTNRATAERFGEYAAVVADGARRPGRPVHHAERAVVLGLPRLRQRRARAGPHRRRRPRSPPCTTSTWRTGAPSPRSGPPRRTAQVGLALNLAWVRPETDSAARRRRRPPRRRPAEPGVPRPDPDGRYPADVLADTAAVTDWSFVQPGDLAAISAPIDVLGVNYYTPTHVRHWTRERPRESADGHGDSGARPWVACDDVEFPRQHGPRTPRWAGRSTRAGSPSCCCGLAAAPPRPAADGHRERRRLRRRRSAPTGASPTPSASPTCATTSPPCTPRSPRARRVSGYFVWSLMDNFEWSYGYAKRFGIVAVDYATQARTPKDSGRFYAEVARANAL